MVTRHECYSFDTGVSPVADGGVPVLLKEGTLRSLGISITRNVLSAVLWEHSLLSSKMEGSCEVPCTDPYGDGEDIARLAEGGPRISGPGPLPSAVLSLPPAWTFLRMIRLPVTDLPRAKKMHISELEGNLPIDAEGG